VSDKNPPDEDEVTVRDLFAAAALTGLLARQDNISIRVNVAFDAFDFADAMMAERERAK